MKANEREQPAQLLLMTPIRRLEDEAADLGVGHQAGQPRLLVDVRGIDELEQVTDSKGSVIFGSCITHATIEDGDVPDIYIAMGQTAENVVQAEGVSRQEMDEWGARSQQRAVESQENGFFEREISPYTLPDGTVVSKDDGPRPGTTVEKLAELKPVFRPDGKVTAGNACPLNDGAAAVIVMSDTKAKELGITPLARIVSSGVTGLNPEIMGLGPIEAIRQALGRANKTVDDIDLFEINEAFAAQVVPSAKTLGIPYEKLNTRGGAIAIGHPFGMTGARIMTTLLNGLEDADKEWGVESMCVGGGQGMAMIVERV